MKRGANMIPQISRKEQDLLEWMHTCHGSNLIIGRRDCNSLSVTYTAFQGRFKRPITSGSNSVHCSGDMAASCFSTVIRRSVVSAACKVGEGSERSGRGKTALLQRLELGRPLTPSYPIIGAGNNDGTIAGEKDLREIASSSVMSKTVNSFVICNRARTLLVRLSSFSSPPWLRMIVKAFTSSPRPELSM